MLVRAIALSTALLLGIAGLAPFATQSAEAGPRKSKKYGKHKKYKKYSKAWWRQHRARMQRKHQLAAKRRAMRLRQLRLARKIEAESPSAAAPANNRFAKIENAAVMLPSGEPAPRGWRPSQSASKGELHFNVDDGRGGQLGSASIAVVGPAMGEGGATQASRSRSIGGVPTASLRREVINRMINENGWVVNDFQKEIGGRKVYVVVAQSQNGGRLSSRTFYFTEVDGRIYSVATNSPADSAERLAEESEKVINSLQNRSRPVQQAAFKEDE